MKIAVLLIVKNEADVLPFWLSYMEDKVDYFLFRDNMSDDGSFEIAQAHPKTVFCERVEGTFRTSLWDKLIVESQQYLSNDDWFLINAPDLFPFFNLREKANYVTSLKEGYNCISSYYPNFFFTKEMYSRYIKDKEYKAKIKNFDIKHFEYFKTPGKAMPLFIKNVNIGGQRVQYTRPKQEPPKIPNKKPYRRELLSIGHYRFRSPNQIKARLKLRAEINPNRVRNKSFKHYPSWNWEDYIISESVLYKYNKSFTRAQLKRISLDHIIR
jgi:hypothetical protein